MATTYEVFQSAYKGHYAVPAINTQGGTYDIIRAVCMVTEEFRFPVILTHYVNTEVYSGHDWFYETAKWMAVKVSVPVAIHLDHRDNFKRCMKMLEPGFTSTVLDGSALPVEENAAATETVARMYRSPGVPLEAEIGELCRLGDKGNKMGVSSITDPDVVRQYLKPCHPDLLTIGIGDAHGFYNESVDIRAGVLEECREFIDIPFALHGCMGVGEELMKRPIDSGVTKIDFSTQVRYQYVNYLEEGLAEGKDQSHAWRLSQYAELRLREDIRDIIRLAGSQEEA